MEKKIVMEFLPNGLWRLLIDGQPTEKRPYEQPLILKDIIAHTAYYGEEQIYQTCGKLDFDSVDHTV